MQNVMPWLLLGAIALGVLAFKGYLPFRIAGAAGNVLGLATRGLASVSAQVAQTPVSVAKTDCPGPVVWGEVQDRIFDSMPASELGRKFALAVQRECRDEIATKVAERARREIASVYLGDFNPDPPGASDPKPSTP